MANAQQPLLDYLAGPALNELMLAMDVRRGLPGILPDAFFKESALKPFSDKVIWNHRTGQRKPATIINPGTPTPQFIPPQQQRAEATAITLGEHMPIDSETIQYLKANVDIIRQRMLEKVTEDLKDWKIRFENARNAAVQNAIFTGQISYLPNGTGTAPGLDGGVPTGMGQIVDSGTTGAVQVPYNLTYGGSNALVVGSVIPNAVGAPTVADWSSSSTNIPANIEALTDGFIKTSNYVPGMVIYGRNIPAYFSANTLMQTFLSRQPALNNEFMVTNEVPKRLLDYDWVPGWKSYYQDYTGAIKTLCGADQIVIIPPISSEWYELVPGGWLLPTGVIPPGMSFEQSIMQTKIQNGYGSYMSWTLDPYQIKIVAKDCFLPIIKVAGVVWQLTVKP